jgi:hypothetical protein
MTSRSGFHALNNYRKRIAGNKLDSWQDSPPGKSPVNPAEGAMAS